MRLANPPARTNLAPPEVAEAGFRVADLCHRWKVGAAKVHGFLRRGELVGINLAANLSGKPMWRVTRESVDCFERRRSSAPPPKAARRRRRTVAIDFYPNGSDGK